VGELVGSDFGVVAEFVGLGSGFGGDLLGLFTDFRGGGEEVVGGTGTDDSDGGVDGGVATSGVAGRRGRRRVLARRRRGRGDGSDPPRLLRGSRILPRRRRLPLPR